MRLRSRPSPAANPSAGGYLGISFRDSTTSTTFFSATDNTTEARFQLDTTGGWKVYNSGTAVDSGLGSNADRTFTITVTSGSTFNASVGTNSYYNLGMAAGGGSIDSLAIYTYGDSNQNSFWKSASLTATGTVQLGYAAASGVTFVPGLVSDGLLATSTSTTKANAVFVGGDAGSQVNLTQANTYTGPTTINANATGEAQNASALGTTDNGTVVSNNAALKLYSGSGISFSAEPSRSMGWACRARAGPCGAWAGRTRGTAPSRSDPAAGSMPTRRAGPVRLRSPEPWPVGRTCCSWGPTEPRSRSAGRSAAEAPHKTARSRRSSRMGRVR